MQPSVSDDSVNLGYKGEGLFRLPDPCTPVCRDKRVVHIATS
jgi:hypothetical protein